MRRSSARLKWLSLALLFCLSANPLFGQEMFGGLYGTVFDDTEAVLPGVTVTLTHRSTGRLIVTETKSEGTFAFRYLDPGPYSVRFELPKFAPTEFPTVTVSTGQALKLDARMSVGTVATIVDVIDAPPGIDLQTALVSRHVPEEEFERLPKSRTFQSLAITAPGVNTGEIEGGIQINGASGAENVFNIDGVATNSPIDGRSRQNAVFEYLQELQIKTAGIEAEHSGALGGVVSVVTKSGGNELHGGVWFYHSGSALTGLPARRLVLDPRDNRSVSYIQDAKNNSRDTETGFSLGGPIRRNKLYFFTAWSPRWTDQDQPYNFSSGTESGIIKRERTFSSGFNKLSFEPSARVRGSIGWLWTPAQTKGTLPVYNAACANCVSSSAAANSINASRGSFAPQSSYTANLDIVLSNNVLLTSRGSYFWDNYKDTGIPNTTSVQYQAPALGPLVPANLQGPIGFQNTPAIQRHEHDRTSRAYGHFGVNISANLGGLHNFKAGFEVQKTINDVNRSYPGGYVYVWWDRSFTSLVTGRVDRGTYGYYEVNDFWTLGSTGAGTQAFYVQDQWRVNDRLTISPGLRMEHERIPSFPAAVKSFAFEFPWKEKLAPRIGASLDVFGSGRLKVSGSWGRFFDSMKYDIVRKVFGGEIWRTYYRSLDTLDVFSLSLNSLPGRDLWNPGGTAFRDRRDPTAGVRSVAPDLKPMSQDQWTVGADYQWNTRTIIGARFLHQNLRRVIEDLAVLVQGNASYIYANPGEGAANEAPFVTGRTALPLPYPKPVRTYDAVELSLRKRFTNNWSGNISYTWSRLFGNYAGLASSDEILTPTTGFSYPAAQQAGGAIANPATNAQRGWDLDEILFDSKGNLDPKGRLATDRPHVLRIYGVYEMFRRNWGATSAGGFFYLASGTPLSTVVHTLNHLPVFVNGRGDMGRTPWLNQTNLQIAHRVNLSETQGIRVELDMFNVFNQQTSRHRFDNLNRGAGISVDSSAIDLRNTDLRNGYNYDALIRATPDGANAFDPRYGQDDLFSEGFSARLGLKWTF